VTYTQSSSEEQVQDSSAAPAPSVTRRAPRHTDRYEHLTPLFAELARLGPDDPRRIELRRRLITGFLPVARNIARKYAYRGENADDLEQVANLGLVQAVDRFDPGRGIDFLSFAVPTITGEVQRHFRDRQAAIRLPRPIWDLQTRVSQAASELSQRNGKAPTPRELAAYLEIDLEAVVEGVQAVFETRTSSLDEPLRRGEQDSGEPTELASVLGDADPSLDLVDDRVSLAPLLDALPAREREILLLRFYGNMTQTEIAKRVGISQMHVSRLLAATLTQLRQHLA
jgi:RNA polymerase sigma-B factor